MWTYSVSVHGHETDEGEVHSGARPSMNVGLPSEFGGRPEVWCPESLLAASVGGCLMTSFRHWLRRGHGCVNSYVSAVRAVMGKTRTGMRVTSVAVTTVIGADGGENVDAARHAAKRAEVTCPISHSLKCPVTVNWEINDVRGSAPGKEERDANL